MDVARRVFPVAGFYAVMRDLVSRGSYIQIVSYILAHNQEWLKQDHNRKYHVYFFGAIIATILSHPLDVIFTKIASQRAMKFTGLLQTPMTILK